MLLRLSVQSDGALRVSGSGRGGQLWHRAEVPSPGLGPPCRHQEVHGLGQRQDGEEDRPEGDQAFEGSCQSITESLIIERSV